VAKTGRDNNLRSTHLSDGLSTLRILRPHGRLTACPRTRRWARKVSVDDVAARWAI